MEAKYLRRLGKLASFLETLPRERFNYNHWVGDDWKGKENLSCGTTACALGWAATMKPFRKLGLRLVMPENDWSPPFVALKDENFPDTPGDWGTSQDAITEVFGTESHDLFFPSDDELKATPKQVAKKIRRFIRKEEKLTELNETIGALQEKLEDLKASRSEMYNDDQT